MRKIITILLCVLVLSATLLQVSADNVITMTITPSKTSVYPGEEVTFTVSVSSVDACTSAGVLLSFDSAVYELTAWECLFSGAQMANYDDNLKFLNFINTKDGEARPLSGDIFRFTLKVKASAKLGSTEISGKPLLRNWDNYWETELKGTKVTVACKHSYDNNCDTTCNTCGATRTISHSWDSGKTTKNPTCTAKGTKEYTCTVCGEKKTENINATGHSYSNDCDASCNTCGEERSITHKYSTKWSSDSSKHWHACSVCGAKKDEKAHTPGPAATEKNPQTCTECGYVLKAALGHAHNYGAEWKKDVIGHWHECTGCEEIQDFQDHVYDDDCDAVCNVCDHIRAAEHTYENRWTADSDGHWHQCSICGDQLEKEPHTPGPEATTETAQICLVCGYELTPIVGHTHEYTWLSNAENHWQQCSCGHTVGEMMEHTWDNGTVTQEPGVNQEGEKTYTCTICGHQHTEIIPAQETAEPTGPSDPQTDLDVVGKVTLPGWLILAAGVGVTALCALFLVIGILIGRKQAERYMD